MDYPQADCTEQDDDVIMRRILINDPDDRRLQTLQKLMVRWVLTDYDKINDSVRTYNHILAILNHIIASKKKNELIQRRTKQETEYFKNLKTALENKISDVKDTIETSKMLLLEAQNEYKKKVVYNILAKELNELPHKEYIKNNLEALKDNFKSLRDKFNEINKDQASWEKNFKHFIKVTDKLNNKLNELRTENHTAFKKMNIK